MTTPRPVLTSPPRDTSRHLAPPHARPSTCATVLFPGCSSPRRCGRQHGCASCSSPRRCGRQHGCANSNARAGRARAAADGAVCRLLRGAVRAARVRGMPRRARAQVPAAAPDAERVQFLIAITTRGMPLARRIEDEARHCRPRADAACAARSWTRTRRGRRSCVPPARSSPSGGRGPRAPPFAHSAAAGMCAREAQRAALAVREVRAAHMRRGDELRAADASLDARDGEQEERRAPYTPLARRADSEPHAGWRSVDPEMACPVDWREFDRMSVNPSTTTGPLDVHAGISDTDQSGRRPGAVVGTRSRRAH